jgi:biofilm protein TabA
MPYFINQSKVPLAKIIPNNNIRFFIESSIESVKKLERGTVEKLIYDASIFSIIQNTILKDRAQCVYESHKKYIDIHIIVDGSESVDVIDIHQVPDAFESSVENDYYLYKLNASSRNYCLQKNMIAIFLFEDAHKVGILSNASSDNVVKVVLKVEKEVFDKEFYFE